MTATQRIRSMLDGSPVKEIGAISLSILPEALRDLAQYRQLIYGVLLVLLMMVKPQGLLGDINFKYIRQRMEHREKSKEAANE